jgi:hypothetical protein
MLRASESELFLDLRKNSKLPVDITVDDIVEELHENYSFKQLNPDDNLHQPKIPHKSWVKEAVNALVTFKLAKWKSEAHGECTIYFKKFRKTLEKFIDLCVEHGFGVEVAEEQLELFESDRA